ncbi:MAG: hypothetical protein ACRD2X_08080 [Vicinamibacteraceae bacterium]
MARFRFSRACGTSPAAMCFWAGVFAVLYGIGLLVRSTWPFFEPYGDTLVLVAFGAACFINFGRNRTLHCGITGPLFLLGAVVAALIEADAWAFDLSTVWGVVLIGVGVALVIEWRTVGQRDRDMCDPVC